MKIVDLNTFRTMPEGTLFSKWKPCVFGELLIKGETTEHDFYAQDIVDAIDAESSESMADMLDDAWRDGTSVDMLFHCQGRDGLYETEQLFAVWGKKDVEQLIERLKESLNEQG